MHVTKHTDWLSVTFPKGTDVQRMFGTLDWHYTGPGMHGYKHRYEDKITGANYQEGAARDEMGVHLTLSGETLNSLRSQVGSDDDQLVRLCASRNGNPSRLDLTINLHEGDITPATLRGCIEDGTASVKTRTWRYIEGSHQNVRGDTLYLGSPDSDRLFRCYNKAAQLGIVDGQAWVRLELQLRRIHADAAFRAIQCNGTAKTVSGYMGDFMSWSNAEYQTALGSDGVQPAELPRPQSNRRRWLFGQVAPALAKEMVLDVDFKALFDAAVQQELDLLK